MPVDVVFIEPCFPANQREFVRALHAVGARVTGVGERPKGSLDPEMRGWLTHYEEVKNVTSEAEIERVVRWLQGRVKVNRLEAVVEAPVVLRSLMSVEVDVTERPVPNVIVPCKGFLIILKLLVSKFPSGSESFKATELLRGISSKVVNLSIMT